MRDEKHAKNILRSENECAKHIEHILFFFANQFD